MKLKLIAVMSISMFFGSSAMAISGGNSASKTGQNAPSAIPGDGIACTHTVEVTPKGFVLDNTKSTDKSQKVSGSMDDAA